MVASLLFCPTNAFCKMNTAYLSTHVYQLHKGIMPFAVYLPFQTFNVKLYVAPTRASSTLCFSGLTPAAMIDAHGRNQEVGFAADILTPTNSKSSMNDIEWQLDDLFCEVKTLISSGKKNDAVVLLEANYIAVKEQMDAGARSIQEAAILDVIALGYMALGDTKAVVSLLGVLNEVVNALKEDEPFLDSILVHMGNMHEKLEKFESAIYQYRRALEIIEQKCGISSSFLVTPMLGMAKALGSSGRATEAVQTYQRVIELLEYHKGPLCEELVVPLFALGKLLLKEERASEAENSFQRILSLYTRLYGEKDGRAGMVMCSLAHVKCATGSVDEAIDLYRDAFRVLKDSKFIELDDELMENMRIDLAELLHVVGRGREGRVLLEECILITEKYQGKDHPSSVIHLMNLATSYSQSKNFAEAERLLRRSLQIMIKTVPPDDQSITFPMLHLAVTLYNLNRDEEAESFALKALHIREKAFGPESIPVGEALDCLVSIQTRLGRNVKDILELLKRVLNIQELAFGHDSKEVVDTLKKIVHYLDKLGMRSEMLPLQRRLSTLRNKYKQMVEY